MPDTDVSTSAASHISRAVIRNTASNFGGKFIALAASFLLTPFLLSKLGATTYGIWMLVASVLSYASVIDLGLSSALIKYTAELRARGENKQAASLISTAFWAYSILGAVVAVFGLIMSVCFAHFFQIPSDQRPAAVQLAILLGIQSGMALPLSTTSSILRGLQRYDIVNAIAIAATIVTAAGTVIVLVLGGGLLSAAAAGVPVVIASFFAQLAAVRRIAPELISLERRPDRGLLKKVFSFSAPLFVVQICDVVQARVSQVVIASYLPVVAVTPYAVTRRLAGLPRILADQFAKVIMPLASSLDAVDDRHRLGSVYIVSTRVALAVLILSGSITCFLGREILVVWLGSRFAPYSHLVLILTLVSVVEVSQWPAGMVLQGMSRHRVLALVAVLEASVTVVLSVILVRRLGLIGAAAAPLIVRALGSFALVTPFTMHVLGIRVSDLFRRVLARPLAAGIPACGVLLVLKPLAGASSVGLIVTIGATFVVYSGTYALLAADFLEIRLARTMARNLIRMARVRPGSV